MAEHTRNITINVPPAVAAGFVTDVSNLPRWVGFFRATGEAAVGNTMCFATPMGVCTTTVAAAGGDGETLFHIVSDFSSKREQADLRLAPVAGGVELGFTLRLPDTLAAGQAEKMLAALEGELSVLKQILEGAQI